MIVISPITDLHNNITSLKGSSAVSTKSSIRFTSVNASLPETCSPITFSIHLENVTSTMIQFNWRPLGGGRDSPYTVRLWGGSRVREEKSINETSTAFRKLLPDHEYQISVDVLTCSKNVSTSMTVRTAAKVFNGTTRILNEDFIPEYQNRSSTAFKEFETKFIKEVEEQLPKEIRKLIKEGKMHIVINSLKNGSVIVDFNIVLDVGESITKREISDAFMEAFNISTTLKVDLKRTFIEARNSCQPGLNDCSKHAICTAEGGTYSCQCKEGFTDNSLQVPGRACQQKQNLPSQHTTAVPRESGTVGFTGSTANSISATTFASGPCISIEVRNVTGEAIQFGWTPEDGRRGSIYIASLMDGNREINKTTTNETKAIFNHLLPGHVYTISVAVLSCGETSRTSVSVRTDPASCFTGSEFCSPQNHGCTDLKHTVCSNYQAFACSVLLKSQTFNHTLYNSDSEDYKTMSESIKTEVVREMHMKLKDDRFDIVMLGFRPGSVIAYFVFLLQKQELIDVNVLQAYLSDILKSKFGDQTEVTIQSLSAQSSPGESPAWKVAVIVLGVLLGVALVLLFLITLAYFYMKKNSGKYLVEPNGLLGNFVYKHL
ncbi:uromodulin-like 1 [Struthio camelus]|uniref:uromodulin-like 1 n=1 Tax=Struthio camelus TaxID=8801 RepID=UPI0036040756